MEKLFLAFFLVSFSVIAEPLITELSPIVVNDTTANKPQSKTWKYAGSHYAVFPDKTGTFVFKLEGRTWVKQLRISCLKKGKADVFPSENRVYVLLVNGTKNNEVIVLESDGSEYSLISRVALTLGKSVETATIALDSAERLWIVYDSIHTVEIIYSDAPYTQFSVPLMLADNITNDDISVIAAIPARRSIGVFWSSQKTRFFAFCEHFDEDAADLWQENERPAYTQALRSGAGFADDHLNFAVESDGTIYTSIKTGYDKKRYTTIGMLVRRANGVWDQKVYNVSTASGSKPMIILNEKENFVEVVYDSNGSGGASTLYKRASLDDLVFPAIPRMYLYKKGFMPTSSKDTSDGDYVIMVTKGKYINSVLVEW